ncbi:MAG: LuxR C-terminal-related transcriptional regulator [Pseudomonadota bacterium]
MSASRLSSKLNPPAVPPSQVIRAQLRALVGPAPRVRVIVLQAPAGFGKTTAMLQCRAHFDEHEIDTAWLTIDAGDNDPARFLDCLGAAVQRLGEQGAPALEAMERLAAHRAPFALFLDECEHLHNPVVLNLLKELIARLPLQCCVVISSRVRLDLGLGRLRVQGQLLELNVEQLRFSAQEASDFLVRQRAIALPEDAIAALYRKTEGWAAALWLASVALERQEGRSDFIARFSGSDGAVADYLADDVLARQTAPVRDFLLRTSILRYLDAPLCDALLERQDSSAVLAALEAANLFLLPIEGMQQSYRYHSLFASFLRARLARDEPALLPRLHLAASAWYEGQQRPVPAIDHALDGGDHVRAIALLERHGEALLEDGRMRLLTRCFDALPEGMLQPHPLVQVVRIWALCYTRGPAAAMALLDASACAASREPAVQAHLLALRPALHAMLDQNEEACRLGSAALAQLPLANQFADRSLVNGMAMMLCTMGQYPQSLQLLDTARRQGGTLGHFQRMYSESVEGLIDLEAGRLRLATARFRLAAGASHANSYKQAHGNAFAGILYADALYEANALGDAEHLLHVYVPLAKDVGLPDHLIIGYTRLARIAFWRGEIDAMWQCLSELEYIGYERHLPRVVAGAKLERARLFLFQGNQCAAQEELQRANDTAVWARVRGQHLPAHDLDYVELAALRWELHFGAPAAALRGLAQEHALALAQGRQRRALKLQLLRSLALQRSGDTLGAQALMHDALQQGGREGYQRLLIDEGPAMAALARRSQPAPDAPRDPIFADYLERLLQHWPAGEPDAAPAAEEALAEALTKKELRILVLLAEGYSNDALADKLFVSTSTVRTHLRNINVKLNAQSRTQAVAIARRHGLID